MRSMFWENLQIAWQALISNKMRSLLTMLGIIIGVASVIALVSIGQGVQKDTEDRFSQLGSNLLIVIPGAPRTPGLRPVAGSLETLHYNDYVSITSLPNVKDASPMVQGSYVVVAGNKNWTTKVIGVTASYRNVRDAEIEEGRYWTEKEYKSRARVALLGKTVAKNLFGDANPIGSKIRVKNDPYVVIGTLAEKGASGGNDADNRILAPFSTVQERLLGITYVQTISVASASADTMSQVEADITNLLRIRHKILPNREDDFTVENMADVLETVQQTMQTLTLFLGAIAAISLLVGGIGIMNIMLVSVTERTREIGIRKALGATYRMIITQFLIESITISLVGGTIGVIVGILGAHAMASLVNVSAAISPWPILGSFAFSVAIGLLFGLYPARKAARLNPIDALHYE